MTIESQAVADRLRRRVCHASPFRANPTNSGHRSYQRAVNRWFILAVVAFPLVCSLHTVGLRETLLRILILVFGSCIVALLLLIVVCVLVSVPDYLKWLNGE